MYDYFRDNFATLSGGLSIGGWDIHNKCYTLSLQSAASGTPVQTLSFDEQVQGWTSRYSYSPNNIVSVQNNFYTTSEGGIYGDSALPVTVYVMPETLTELDDQLFKNEFKRKEDKYFANLVNSTAFTQGEIVFGSSISGIKGYTAEVTFTCSNPQDKSELFAISTNYKESSY